MRIEANLTADLDGKPIVINWKNKKHSKQLRQVSDKFLEGTDKIKKLKGESYEKAADKLLAEFYRDQCEVMFDFPGGLPDVEWFARDEFPVGQFEFLRQVFTNPQVQM